MNFKDILYLLKTEVITRFIGHRPRYDKKYTISICAIFKDEGPFLGEWIELNHVVGVEHFYLYNNNSTDNYLEVLLPYINKGLVTLVDFPYVHAQNKAYENFYSKYRHETQWVAFLDLDEFFVPIKKQTLQDWIKEYEKYPAIQIYWKMFGTSGLLFHDYDEFVTEQYHICWKNLYYCGKCIVNTDYDFAIFSASCNHSSIVNVAFLGKNIQIPPMNIFHRSTIGNGTFIKWGINEDDASIQINHYSSKAWDIYDAKRKRTDAIHAKNPREDINYFYAHEKNNNTVDYNIYKYIMQAKLNMQNTNK